MTDASRLRFTTALEGVAPEHLAGFFEGWPSPPDPATHLALLRGSDAVALAVEEGTGRVAGFVTAITDGVLAAYLPLLEVRPEHRGRGVGRELVRRVLAELGDLYMVDAVCDEDVLPFYEGLGFTPGRAALLRRYELQCGRGGA